MLKERHQMSIHQLLLRLLQATLAQMMMILRMKKKMRILHQTTSY